jgi:hypothetical protein
VDGEKSINGDGAVDAEILGVGKGVDVGIAVAVGGKGLGDGEVILDSARTDFAKPTVIIQILFSG